MAKRPIFIEFSGTPNSGKTTLIKGLSDYLISRSYSVKIMREDAEIVPNYIPKKTWDRNLWITCSQLTSLIASVYDEDVDIVIFDRGYIDALFWANFYLFQRVIEIEDFLSITNFLEYLNNHLYLEPDCFIGVDVSPEVSLKRRMKQNSSVQVTMSTTEFLTMYSEYFKDFCFNHISSNVPVCYLDTSTKDVDAATKVVINYLENNIYI